MKQKRGNGRATAGAVAVVLALLGCTTRGYDGPDLPPEQIATLTISRQPGVSLEGLTIDRRPFGTFADNVELLPGRKEISLSYRAEGADRCDSHGWCDVAIDYGRCEGSASLLAGRTYLLTIDPRSSVRATLSPKGYFDLFNRDDESPVSLPCRTTDTYDTYRVR